MTPVAPTLPAGTVLGFSYEAGVDINLGTPEAPVWQPIRRPSGIAQKVEPIVVNVATYDDYGAPNEDKISEKFSLSFTVLENRDESTGLSLPEIEKLDWYTRPAQTGAAAVAHVRWYHKPSGAVTPNPVAYMGKATVAIERGNTGNADVGLWTVTLTGKGMREEIVNPYGGQVAVVPTIATVTPSLAAVGDQVRIDGSGFTGTTGVTVDGIAAAEYMVVGGSTIVVVIPAAVVGAAPVIVTNTTGPSTAYAYTAA